ncbi:MAG: hypothetical protein QHH30_03305 [candidate division NC10 bacterium]|nr:hypothetical protein [candidate division NC10 bacterium]
MAMRLGEALVKEGLITNQQLAKALERQVVYGGRLGTNLIELNILTEEALVRFMGKIFKVPYADPKAFEGIKQAIIETINPTVAERYLVIPIDREPKRLHLAMANPTDLLVIDEIRFITGYEIVPYIASELRLLYALERYYGIRRPVRYISVLSEEPQEIPQEGATEAFLSSSSVATPPEIKEAEVAEGAVAAPVSISQRLVEAKDREEIASIILDCASLSLKRAALFVVKADAVIGWKGMGNELTDERMSQIQMSLQQPSIFRAVIDGRNFYQGVMAPMPQNLALLKMMGGQVPQEAIAFPLAIKGKVVCVLYGDNGDQSRLSGDLEELKKVMVKASMALEMLILKKKILEM